MRSSALICLEVGFLVVSVLFEPAAVVHAQSQGESTVQAPMAQIAREYAWRPIRADILPQVQGVKAGDPVPVRVVLLDGSGKLTNAIENTPLVVGATGPSQRPVTVNVGIATGASAADLLLPAIVPGLVKLTVRQPENRVLDSSNFVLIAPAQPQAKANKKLKKLSMSVVEFQEDTPYSAGGTPAPQLMFQVSGERDTNVRADGVSYERIAVYYMDAEPTPFPIQIWLTWDHGNVKPNPVIIKKGGCLPKRIGPQARRLQTRRCRLSTSSRASR